MFAVAAPHEGQSYVEVVVGVLSAISLLLLLVFVVIVVLSKRHKLQGSPTTILRNSFGATINMKVCATHYLGFSLLRAVTTTREREREQQQILVFLSSKPDLYNKPKRANFITRGSLVFSGTEFY